MNGIIIWLSENAATVIVTAILAACIFFAVFCIIRKRKRGGCSCGCGGCDGCDKKK